MRIEHGLLPGHVLQRTPRGARATVSGTCPTSGPVTATVRKGVRPLPGLKAVRVGTAAEGRFSAILSAMPTGGPYSIEFACGASRTTVDEVYVGDLWLMAGQSNMEGIGNMIDAPEPHPLVRSLTMGRYWEQARDPLHYLAESPDQVHGGFAASPAQRAMMRKAKRRSPKGVGVGVWFGKAMHRRSGVPQGLIATAHGGTSMAQWDPHLKGQGGGSLYGSMLLSLQTVAQPIAGVLWYQGCTDAGSDEAVRNYTARMQALVAAVRSDLGQPELPWIIVQIARTINDQDNATRWNAIQERQRCLPASIPLCDVVPTIDLDLDDRVHVSGKGHGLLAERMARIAARLVLGDRREKPAIQPLSAGYDEVRLPNQIVVVVRFANAVGGLRSAGRPAGFTILDEKGVPTNVIHKVRLERDRAILHLTCGSQAGWSVQYGRGADPYCNLTDATGMAVPVFAPLPIRGTTTLSPYLMRWRVSPIRPGEDIARLPRPDPADAEAVERLFPGKDLVNCHPQWQEATGHVGFTSHIELDEAMDLELRTGYDGPFRLWVGDREVHTGLKGTNPALIDAHRIRLSLPRGRHPVCLLMALNHGRAWGFFLRFARRDGTGEQPALPKPWA